jgi:hypothetical protein
MRTHKQRARCWTRPPVCMKRADEPQRTRSRICACASSDRPFGSAATSTRVARTALKQTESSPAEAHQLREANAPISTVLRAAWGRQNARNGVTNSQAFSHAWGITGKRDPHLSSNCSSASRARPARPAGLSGSLVGHAVPAWTRARNWTTALLAFKIHFGDRLPE